MNAKSKITPFPTDEVLTEENTWLLSLVKNKKKILWGVAYVLFSGALAGWAVHQVQCVQNKKTSLAYESLDESSGLQSHANLKEVSKIAGRYKFMQSHLDAPLAQAFLNRKEVAESKKLVRRIESRLAPNLDALFAFNKITLEIAEQNYDQALKMSYELNEQLSKKNMPTLYEYQTLRTALLEKKLHQKNIEKEASVLNSTLTLGKLSLRDFIIKEEI